MAAMLALGGLVGTSSLSAQSVTTAPVGAMSYSVPANTTQSLGFPILRPAVLVASVSAGDSGTITVSGSGINFATLLAGTSPYFIEVIGHNDGVTSANVGERFEVNESTSITAASNVLTIDTASTLNTSSGSLASLVGYKVAIRPHWTLSSLFGTGTTATTLNSSTTFASADQVLAWTGSSFSTFWFRQNSAGTTKEWRNTSTNTTNQDNAIVPPGVGVFFRRQAGNLTITSVGDVRTNKFVRNLDSSTQLLAMGYPVDRTPIQLGFNTAGSFVANTSFGSADQLLTWTGSAFSTYWYRRNSASTTFEWRNTGTATTDHSNTSFINASQAVFVRPSSGSTPNDLIQTVPFTL